MPNHLHTKSIMTDDGLFMPDFSRFASSLSLFTRFMSCCKRPEAKGAEGGISLRGFGKKDLYHFSITPNRKNFGHVRPARTGRKRLLKLTDWSNAEIARRLAVDPATVTRWQSSIANAIDTRQQSRTVNRGGCVSGKAGFDKLFFCGIMLPLETQGRRP